MSYQEFKEKWIAENFPNATGCDGEFDLYLMAHYQVVLENRVQSLKSVLNYVLVCDSCERMIKEVLKND